SVRSEDGDAIAPANVEVERAQAERPPLDDGALEPRDDVSAARARLDLEAEAPRLPRLLGALEAVELLLERLADVLRLLLLAPLAIAALLPLLHPAALLEDPVPFVDVVVVLAVLA